MIIETERLHIRPIAADDWRSVKEIWEDFNKSQYSCYDMPHCTEDEDVRARMEKWERAFGREHMFFAACLEDTVIGYIAFNIRENGYEAGYCFHSAYAGRGFAKESHMALFDYLRSIGVKRVTARTALENLPSVGMLRTLGFTEIGREKVSFYNDAQGNRIFFDGGIFELML